MQRFPHFIVTFALWACGDPVASNQIADLGPEQKGERPGPTHRAGQPCGVCHTAGGPGEGEFILAGTVYESAQSSTPAVGATVIVTDAKGKVFQVPRATNRVGNFYVQSRENPLTFPLTAVTVRAAGYADAIMRTPIHSAESCASCHRGNGSQGRVPAVYLGRKL